MPALLELLAPCQEHSLAPQEHSATVTPTVTVTATEEGARAYVPRFIRGGPRALLMEGDTP